MAQGLTKGDKVRWDWGKGTGEGRIAERFERRVQRTIEGARIVRNGSADNPAFLIRQEDGASLLKPGSELSRVT